MALATMALVVCLAPQLMAGTTAPTVIAIVVLAPLAALAAHMAFAKHAPTMREPLLVLAALAAANVALQASPLPTGVVEALAPESAVTARDAALLIDASAPTWATLSVDPIATRRELAEGAALVCILLAAWTASAAGERLWVTRIAAASIVLVAVVTAVHAILDIRTPFGVVPEPTFETAFIGPILNQNQLAGLLGAGVPISIACALEHDRLQQRAPWVVAAVGLALMTMLCGSRGGVLSLVVGIIVFVLIVPRTGSSRSSRRLVLGVTAALVSIATITTFVVVGGSMIDETMRGLPKLRLFAQSFDLVPHSPWLGTGRGAYSAAFVRLHGSDERPEHPENIIVEWIVELGLPLAIALVGAIVWSLVRAGRAIRSPAHSGAIAAVVSLAAHDQFDFAMEMVGTACVGAWILGAAIAPSNRHDAPAIDRQPVPIAAVAITAIIIAALVAQPVATLSVPRLRADMIEGIRARDWERVDRLVRLGVAAHPSEPVITLLAGHAAVVADRDDALRWLNRTMVLAPEWFEPHHLAARWLASHGATEQAWLEVREVRRLAPSQATRPGCIVATGPGSASAAIRVLGDDHDLLDALVACASPDEATTLDEHLAAAGDRRALARRARRALTRGDVDGALRMLAGITADDPVLDFTRADALAAAGRHAEAVRLLAARADTNPSVEAVERLARAQAAGRDEDGMRATVQRLVEMGDGSPEHIVRCRLLLADLESATGHPALALAALEEADGIDPNSPALGRILVTARQLGDSRRERLALRELCRREGPDGASCRDLERLERPAQLPAIRPIP